ncbi:MAG TPA: hypothetical protein PLG55_00725 [Methanospirillum sp.]|uniref:hypothetical protein n=1 Tax=Methanospirillum sp. TaxID=45200 RepID=UPI002C1DDFD5|nr:hypothetical protein [Methanospirillum sp.]HPY59234.1 hypothetical protein [Methanospirillum sp.]
MHFPAACIVSICLILSLCLVTGSSVMIIVFEQSDRTVLIPEAIVYADGKIAGKTDINGAFSLDFEGYRPALRVVKGGYTEWTGSPAENDTAILVPLQVRNSTLHVEVFDADTFVPVQDAYIVITAEDGTRQEARSGSEGKADLGLRADQVYSIEITAPNFQAAHDTVVTGGDLTNVQYSLVRNDRISIRVLDSAGSFPIQSAHIQIDGIKTGTTNDRGILISNTSRNVEHTFDISAEGYESVHVTRTISFEDQVVDFPLVKAKSTVFVSVYNRDQKPLSNASVLMDGVLLGDTNEFGRLMVPALEIRQYEFVVNRDGYKKNTLSFTPGKETGELIIVLESEFTDLEVFARDAHGGPLKDVTIFLLGDAQETLNTCGTDVNGTCLLPAIEGKMYRIRAEKGGYYPNSSAADTQSNPNTIILHNPATAGTDPTGSFPLIPVAAGLVLVVIGAGLYLFIKGRRPRRKSRTNRRRSL